MARLCHLCAHTYLPLPWCLLLTTTMPWLVQLQKPEKEPHQLAGGFVVAMALHFGAPFTATCSARRHTPAIYYTPLLFGTVLLRAFSARALLVLRGGVRRWRWRADVPWRARVGTCSPLSSLPFFFFPPRRVQRPSCWAWWRGVTTGVAWYVWRLNDLPAFLTRRDPFTTHARHTLP